MEIRFGNLSIEKFSERTGWDFSEEDIKWLKEHRTDIASFTDKDKFHIFDAPFCIVVGEDILEKLKEMLIKYNSATETKRQFDVLF